MKTLILTIATLISTTIGVSQSAFAKTGNQEEMSTTILTDVSRISKIEVHGNVELFVSNGSADQVKVYNKYYAQSALVQDQNRVLSISSYASKKLVVWVTANELTSLSVYDNAEVRSFGKLSAIDLEVNLFNNASAKLDVDTYNAAISLNDRAKADLSGNANQGVIKYDQSASLNTTGLVSAKVTKAINYVKTEISDMPELAIL